MTSYLCVSVRFLQPYYHGRGDGDEPEWPPSPLRLFQSLVAAASQRWRDEFQVHAAPALQWLEKQSSTIVAGSARPASTKYRLYVPDNIADKIAKSWAGGREATIADYRTEKDVRPMCLSQDAVHYLFPLTDDGCPHLQALTLATHSITHLGWGIDMVAAHAAVLSEQQAASLAGDCWKSVIDADAPALRAPREGTLVTLIAKHQAFLNRISRDARGNESFSPVPPSSAFRVVGYRRSSDAVSRPYVVFELRDDEGTFFRYPADKFIHISGMVRHLAIQAMTRSRPDGVSDYWVESYVAGHAQSGASEHRQLSYLPLASIGHAHTDPAVRRVMISAPLGDERLLRHLALRLAGQQLKPTPQTKMSDPPTLVRIVPDGVARLYSEAAASWASVTPVILPGHDDHKPAKTRKLIELALRQSGVEQACEFEWSAYSRFPKSLSAHKYDRHKRPTGYIRPDHLLSQTAVHLKLRFANDVKVPGPLAIGAGRHCGFGLMARINEGGEA